jgi:hypothetical protein
MRRMRTLALAAALAVPSAAAPSAPPSWESRVRSMLPAGLELPDAPAALVGRPAYRPVALAADTESVALDPLFERHLSRTQGYFAGALHVEVAGTLDLAGDGYLAVTPRGQPTRFIKIQRGMSGSWQAGGQRYSVSLSINIFRPRLNNYIVIRDAGGRTVWELQIRELFRSTYGAGEPVVVGGRPYRLFYSRQPDGSARRGLCFIYEDNSTGTREYRFYLIPVDQLQSGSPSSYTLHGGDRINLRLSPDRSVLHLSR